MSSSCSSLPFFLLLVAIAVLHHGAPLADASLVNATCNAALNASHGCVNYDVCVAALSSVPARATADTRVLAVISANLTMANVTSTVAVIEDLVKNLNSCLRYYKGMNALEAGAIEDLKSGHAAAAASKLSEATFTPDDCDILLLQGSAGKNPLSKENANANDLSLIAYQIAELVK